MSARNPHNLTSREDGDTSTFESNDKGTGGVEHLGLALIEKGRDMNDLFSVFLEREAGVEDEHPKQYGNRDCQASKGFDKHVSDGDAGFVDMYAYLF